MEYITEAELVERMGLSRYTLWKLRCDGLPFLRIRGRVRYEPANVEAWIQERCQGQAKTDN